MTHNIVVLDSNVLIATLNLNDVRNAECVALVDKLADEGYEIIAPATALWDVNAYLDHPEKTKLHKPNADVSLKVTHYDVTHSLFTVTYTSAMAAVKGPDRVFVSLAKAHGVPLITNDKQIIANALKLGIAARTVAQFVSGES